MFTIFVEYVLNDGKYIDHEWAKVFLVEVCGLHKPREQLTLQEEEVEDIALLHYSHVERLFREGHPQFVPVPNGGYFQFFDMLREKYPAASDDDEAALTAFLE